MHSQNTRLVRSHILPNENRKRLPSRLCTENRMYCSGQVDAKKNRDQRQIDLDPNIFGQDGEGSLHGLSCPVYDIMDAE